VNVTGPHPYWRSRSGEGLLLDERHTLLGSRSAMSFEFIESPGLPAANYWSSLMMKPSGGPGSPLIARSLAIIVLWPQRTFCPATRTEAVATVADMTAECFHRAD